MTGESRLDLLKRLPRDVQVEIAENFFRKDLTESEKAKIQKLLREKLSNKTVQGRRSDVSFNKEYQDLEDAGATNTKIARVLGESRETVRKRDHVFKDDLPEDTAKALDGGKRSLHSVWVEKMKEENLARPVPLLPEGRYGHIVEDPGWHFDNDIGGAGGSGAAVKYRTMQSSDIAKIPVSDMAADNAVLYLWTTNHHLMTGSMALSEFLNIVYSVDSGLSPTIKVQSDALAVMICHGFQPKHIITWEKVGKAGWGGYSFANVTEHLLVGTRGTVRPFGLKDPTIIKSAYDKNHSKKPEEAWQLIEKCVEATGWGGKIELNARAPREGWKQCGDDME